MERLGLYLCQFAELLGSENKPVFKSIRRKSIGIQAYVPPDYQQKALVRLIKARQQDGKLGNRLREIEGLLSQDEIATAQLLDQNENVIYLFHGAPQPILESARIFQSGTVDGVVTGVVPERAIRLVLPNK
jgi:hypothetical protein